jgi:hypothetical protein
VILVLVLLVAGCSDSDPEEAGSDRKEEAKPASHGEKVAAYLGCTTTEKHEPYSGYQETFECRLAGHGGNLLLTFDVRNRGSVERTFTTDPGNSGAPPSRGVCPDGKPVPYWWFLLGTEWVVRTNHEEVRDELIERFDAVVVEEGPVPPVTSTMDPCDREPPG